jgi:hypothetical protein
MMTPRFSPDITLGHLIQAVTLVAMIGGGAITSYVSLRAEIGAAAERASKGISDINARVVVLETRREIDERFQTEARRDLGRLLDAVNDLKIQLVSKQDRGTADRK